VDSRISVICRGESRRRLEYIAGRRGQTMTALASYMLAEAVDKVYTQMLPPGVDASYMTKDGRADHSRKK